jgi:hypothetical protein
MESAVVSQTRDRLAVALSLAIHIALLLGLAAVLARSVRTFTGPVERDTEVPLTTIVVQTEPSPARVHAAQRHRATAGSRPRVEEQPRPLIAPAPLARRRQKPIDAVVASSSVKPAAPEPAVHAALLPIPPVAIVRAAPVAAVATAVPSNSPPPAPQTATPIPANAANYGGLFSQDYPPALVAPDELTPIRAQLPGHVRVRIEIDEAGHATDVVFSGDLTDTELAERVRSQLLALRYVPADCNGLHCDGTLIIDT